MILNPLNWGRRRRDTTDAQSILDLDPAAYDVKTRLPAHVQVGAYRTRPLLSIQDKIATVLSNHSTPVYTTVHDHLVVLKAFNGIAQREGTHFHRLADSAAFEYERWAQVVLPLQQRRRTRRSNSSGRSSSGPWSVASPVSTSPSTLASPLSDSSRFSTPPSVPDSPRKKQPTLTVDELPPLSVLMCWHAHLLNPRQFAIDTEGGYAALADMAFPLSAVAEALRTGSLPGEIEHFPADALRPVLSISGWMPPDISAAVQRQARIVAALREAGWLEHSFIKTESAKFQHSIVRYHAWLDLMAATGQKLAPTVDIELAWRTHQLKGKRYRLETQLILGMPLDQTDRGDELLIRRTAELWSKRYRGHDYIEARSRAPGDKSGLGLLKPLRRSTL